MPLPKGASHEFTQGYQVGIVNRTISSPYRGEQDVEWNRGYHAGQADRELMERVVLASNPLLAENIELLERIESQRQVIRQLQEDNLRLEQDIKDMGTKLDISEDRVKWRDGYISRLDERISKAKEALA